MSTSTRQVPSDPIQSVQRRFERWRSTRSPGERIPASLWQAAVEAAREQGVSKVAAALGLNHTVLKARIKATAAEVRRGAFVPVALPPLPAGPACVVVIEDGDGVRLRVELTGPLASQADAIARSLWGARA